MRKLLLLLKVKAFVALTLFCLGFLAHPAAAITYYVDYDIAPFTPPPGFGFTRQAGSVSGWIETDGSLGVLAAANITAFEFASQVGAAAPINFGSATGGGVFVTGSLLTATTSSLLFNFSGTGGSTFFSSENRARCDFFLQILNACDGYRPGLGVFGAGNYSFAPQSGNVAFANIAPVPLPASLPLLVFGVALLAWIARARRGTQLVAG